MRGEDRFYVFSGILTAATAALAAFLFFGPVPCFDDWILVPLVDGIYAGQIPWADFWAAHNEHRLLFTKLVLSFWAAATHWDLWAVPFLDLALIGWATAHLSSAGEAKPVPFWRRPGFWLALIFTLSLRATKAALWPIMFSAYASSALVVLALALIGGHHEQVRRWFGASLLVVVASFLFAGGMMAWPAVLPLLFFLRRGRWSLPAASIWTVAAAWTFFFYFRDLPAGGHTSLLDSLKQPVEYGAFFFRYVGSMFEPMPGIAFGIVGTFLSLKLVWSAKQNREPRESVFASVVLWVLANAAVTTAARMHFGLQAATTDRYLPVSAFLWASLAIWMLPMKTKLARRTLIFLVGCVLALAPGHAWVAHRYRESHKWAETVLKKESPAQDELAAIFYDPERLPGYISILKKRELSVFRKDYGRAAEAAVRREDASA